MGSKQALPPQAYTKETLVKAFQWLEEQSSEVKNLVKTPDDLVRAYLGTQNIIFDSDNNASSNNDNNSKSNSDFTHVKLKTTEITSSSKELELSRGPSNGTGNNSTTTTYKHFDENIPRARLEQNTSSHTYSNKTDNSPQSKSFGLGKTDFSKSVDGPSEIFFTNDAQIPVDSSISKEYLSEESSTKNFNNTDNQDLSQKLDNTQIYSTKSVARPKALLNYELDQVSINTIEKVKLFFNLSNDVEALRAALAMAERSLTKATKKSDL